MTKRRYHVTPRYGNTRRNAAAASIVDLVTGVIVGILIWHLMRG